MSTPRWSSDNLQDHYEKRLRNDDRCWREILKIDRSMTQQEYEKASQEAYEKAALEYEAAYRDRWPAVYRVDKKTVLAIISRDKSRWITCYHRHYNGRHETGSATPKLENLIVFIDDVDALMDGKIETLYRIEPLKENLSKNQLKKYIGPNLMPVVNPLILEGFAHLYTTMIYPARSSFG